MEEKIVRIDSLASSGTQSIVKWRVRRGVSGLRPPPGGPHAATKVVFCTRLKKSFLRS